MAKWWKIKYLLQRRMTRVETRAVHSPGTQQHHAARCLARKTFCAFSFPAASRIVSAVSAPLDFLKIFAGQLRAADIPFAITSGMACVHYGLQQNTKDSDWIIPADALERLRELLTKREGDLPPWRVSYRQIFGAPLDAEFMQHGWTSHLSIWDNAASV